jgi:hypothetical protein
VGIKAPAWLTWLLLAALVAVYAGERIVPQMTMARWVLTGGGILLVFAAVLLRLRSWRSADGDNREVERIFFLCYAGMALALMAFLVAGDGLQWTQLEPADPEPAQRVETAAAVIGGILLSVSLLPLLAAQWAVGFRSSKAQGAGAVDRLRVSQLAATGLTVGLAAPFLMLTGYVASENDKTIDLSYFRTSSPGTATQALVQSLTGPLRVVLFFPPRSGVTDQVRGYFNALADEVGNVEVEQQDYMAAPELAEQYRVIRDGTIVLAVGDRFERVVLPEQLREARLQLRTLDDDVQEALARVARNQRTIYRTVGHGELNDPGTASAMDTTGFGSVFAMESMANQLNYDVRNLGIQEGLGRDVPADAAMVMVIGPRRPFFEPELRSLDLYLERGGSILLALEPDSQFQLGILAQRLGIQFKATPLADEESFIVYRDNISDRRIIYSDRITSHAALAYSSQAAMGQPMTFMGTGSLEPNPEDPRVTVLVRALPTTFEDANNDYQRQEAEEQLMFPLVVAIGNVEADPDQEAPVVPADTTQAQGMRAMVFADAEVLSDRMVVSVGMNEALLADAIRWLGREEDLAGETSSEADIPLRHTRAEDVAWFYSIILGAPTLVLLLGLVGVRRRRHTAGGEATGES